MKIFHCVGFRGVQPTNTAALVVAETEAIAKKMLNKELTERGLPKLRSWDDLIELDTSEAGVWIMCDGDY